MSPFARFTDLVGLHWRLDCQRRQIAALEAQRETDERVLALVRRALLHALSDLTRARALQHRGGHRDG